MYKEAADLLFHPRIFFEQKNRESPGLFIPAVIVGAGGVVTLISPFVQILFTRNGGMSNVIITPAAAAYFLILPFALWLVTAGVLYIVSRLLSGTGSFLATLQNCGYGYLPQTLLSPLVVINGIAQPWIAVMQPSIITMVLVTVLGGGLIIRVFWSGVLWTAAMETTHGLPRLRAMAGPVIVVLFSLLPLLLVILIESGVRVPLL